MDILADKIVLGKKIIPFDFGGGNLSSDAGVLLFREFAYALGLDQAIADAFPADNRRHPVHSRASILTQILLQICSGYATDDTADHLAEDPVFTSVLGKKRLASQPTLSRFFASLDDDSLGALNRLLRFTRQQAYRIKEPEKVIFDVDTTMLHTSGHQEGSAYIHHYRDTGYHPILCYDGMTGDLLREELRRGNMYCGKESETFLKPLLEEFQKCYPHTQVMVRGDSGFAMPALYETVEAFPHASYVIRLKDNAILEEKITDATAEILTQAASPRTLLPITSYGEFQYQAKAWRKARRVVYKLEMKQGELFPTPMFVVTNRTDNPEDVIRLYCKRGKMENFIKESKREFAFGHIPSRSMVDNANRLAIASLAYNIVNLFRRLCLSKAYSKLRASELRQRLVKIAARAVKHAGKIMFRLCSSCTDKEPFLTAHHAIQRLRTTLATA